jgi:hypothetical protein
MASESKCLAASHKSQMQGKTTNARSSAGHTLGATAVVIMLRGAFRRPALRGSSRSSLTALYGFGDTRPFALALLIFTALSGSCCPCGVVMTKFSDHVVTFRSSLTVVADIPLSGSASTRILSGKPPRAMWSAGMFLGLYCIGAPSLFVMPDISLSSPRVHPWMR